MKLTQKTFSVACRESSEQLVTSPDQSRRSTLSCVKALLSAGAIGVLVLTAGCQSGAGAGRDAAGKRVAPTHSASRDGITGFSATLVVYGMSCPLCASNVERQLQAVPGVTGVTIDMSTGETKLTLDGSSRTTRRMLADAIKRSGFTLKEVRIP